ncbi:MAG: pyrroloquinoline quinone-dependent dehydrogenase [Hyphomicrobiaceae bacterium]
MSRRIKFWLGAGLAAAAVGIYVLINFNWIAPYFLLPVRKVESHADGTIKVQQNKSATKQAAAEPKEQSQAAASDKSVEADPSRQGIWWGGAGSKDPEVVKGEKPPKNSIPLENMPAGTMTTEPAADASVERQAAELADPGDWPNFNKTLTSARFSGLKLINKENVSKLKVHCTYDTGKFGSFTTGLLNVKNTLYFTTTFETFAVDAETCKEKWRVTENYRPATPQGAQRGPAYGDGRIYRGLTDARVIAYDAETGKKLWDVVVGNPSNTESVVAAPIAWNGMVFVGNAGGDFKGNKGRMYGIDGATGKIVWEFFMVPKGPNDKTYGPGPVVDNQLGTNKTWGNEPDVPISGGGTWTAYTIDPEKGLLYVPGGNPAPDFVPSLRPGDNLYSGSLVILDAKTGTYKGHIPIQPRDFHDWDVSGPPSLVKTKAGRDVILLAPKDGHLYSFDEATLERIFKTPATTMKNTDAPLEVGKPVYFCPGISGGAEWNGPSYNPENNLVYIGEMDWCTTVTRQSDETVKNWPAKLPWFGNSFVNPFDSLGKLDTAHWGGWVYAIDADSGKWKWRVKTNYPIWAATLSTAGGLVFFGDVGGNFYALDADTGAKLFHKKMDGAMGGGLITYVSNGKQRIAVAAGLTQIILPTQVAKNKVVVMSVD